MIVLDNVTKTYNKGQKNEFTALKNVSLKIDDGELVAVTGTSGAGKSTMLYVISGIDSYEAGSVLLDGEELKNQKDAARAKILNRKIGFVMQDFALIEDFTAIENVSLPLHFSKHKKKEIKQMAMEALKKVEIEELANKTVNQLSGGQKQRVAIARAIVSSPKYLLADEPTGALDSKTSTEIMNLFVKLNEGGQTTIILTHDPIVAGRCKRIIEISDGEVV
jgi:putative ABC transport system ATP-binding protein